MSTVKKYEDGKQHATFGEYRLSKALNTIDHLDTTESNKQVYHFLFEKAFELGYAAAKESTEQEITEQISKLEDMDSESLKEYFELRKRISDALNLQNVVIED